MLISYAWAGHGVASTGSTGGGDALLIILGVGILIGLALMGRNRLRKRRAKRDDKDEARGI